jgi:hypothetical protein
MALAVLVLAIIGNPILLYLIQDRLLFYPRPVNEGNRKLIKERYASVQEVTVVSSDGTKLQGWFQQTRKAAKAPLLITTASRASQERSSGSRPPRSFSNIDSIRSHWLPRFANRRSSWSPPLLAAIGEAQ